MVFGQLLVATAVGLFTPTMSLQAGHTGAAVLSCLVLDGQIGLLASVAASSLSRWMQGLRRRRSVKGSRKVQLGSLAIALLSTLVPGWSLTH